MKRFLRYVVSVIAYPIPMRYFISLSRINVIYPFYHIVSDQAPAHVKHLYKVRSELQFKSDLDFFTKHFIPLNSIPDNPIKNDVPSFHLSFDDGLSECFHVISPILKLYRINASFFINTDFVGNKEFFYNYKLSFLINELSAKDSSSRKIIRKKLGIKKGFQRFGIKEFNDKKISEPGVLEEIANKLDVDIKDYIEKNAIYMNHDQISDLINEGHRIGSHGKGHYLFSGLSHEEQFKEIIDSLDHIKKTFHTQAELFAYPFTDHGADPKVLKELYESGRLKYSFGTAGIKRDEIPFHIQRIPIEKYGCSARKTVKTEYALYIIKRLFNKHIVFR